MGQKSYMSCLSQMGQNGTLCYLFCPFSEIILIFGQSNRGQVIESKWDKTSYLTHDPFGSKWENFRISGQSNRGQKSYLTLDTKKILVSIFFRVSLSQSVTSRNRQCGVSVATLVCPIYP